MAEGACRALIADAADDPGPADAMVCGRAAVIPAMGSVLVAGHNPFGALAFRVVAAQSVPLVGAAPLDCCGVDADAVIVEVLDACDERLDEELDRCALFLGMNMPPPPFSALHACRLMF
jgi:hypothetical protein